jgi:hypothetical protein
MNFNDRIAELVNAGASIFIQNEKVLTDGKKIYDLYTFLPAVDDVRKTERFKMFVDFAGTENEVADYIDSKPSILITPTTPTPIGTDQQIVDATAVKWVKYEIMHQEGQATVNGYVSLSEKEVVYQSWIVQSEKGVLTAYQQKV